MPASNGGSVPAAMTSAQPRSTLWHWHCGWKLLLHCACSRLCFWTVTSPGQSGSFIIPARRLQGRLNRKISGSREWWSHRRVRRKGRKGGVGAEVRKQERLNAQKDRPWVILLFLMRRRHGDKSGPPGSPCILESILTHRMLQLRPAFIHSTLYPCP